MKARSISVLLALAAFVLAASRINHGLIDSSLPAGPGMTLDESFNIQQGAYCFEAFCHHGPLLFTPTVAQKVFGSPDYFPDHPPLGRVLLAAAHEATSWAIPGAGRSAYHVPAARLGSCFALAVTVFLLAEFTRRRYGQTTAVTAALALMLMPCVIGHARLAVLETSTMLAWLATFVPLWAWWTGPAAPTTKQSLISGVLWGLLLATKVQGILVPPLVFGWAVWQFRTRAVRPLVLWSVTGLVVVFAAWPWLWLDPIGHTSSYLLKASQRPTIYVWYLGQRWTDKTVPWHYPFVITAITVPLVVFALFVLRLYRRRFEAIEQLILLSVLWPLLVFALPGTPVYDGSRLFLVIMPALALLAAQGAVGFAAPDPVADRNQASVGRSDRISLAKWVCLLILSVPAVFKVLDPFSLDSYGVLVGNAAGAERLGMEASYWADGLNGDFWEQVPENSTVYVAPVSHQFQLSDSEHLVPLVAERNIRLLPFEYDADKQRGLILLIHRLADLRPALRHVPQGAVVVAEARYDGVVLARLIDTTEATWESIPDWPDHEQ